MKVSKRQSTVRIALWAAVAAMSAVAPVTPALAQVNPVPLINQPLVPEATQPGGAAFMLTVNGTGFVQGSVVDWNGQALATTFVSGSQLTAGVPASNVAVSGTTSVTVVNPGQLEARSNPTPFQAVTTIRSVLLSQSDLPTDQVTQSVAIADFNGDGNLDIAVVGLSTASVFLGNGNGTFGARADYPTPCGGAGSIMAADFNRDGKIDLVLISNPDSCILLGNGDGTFQPALTFTTNTGGGTGGVAAADFNRDGKLDLAVANYNGNSVSIVLGNGDGTFQPQVDYATGFEPVALASGDFNGDGNLDLAVTTFCGDDPACSSGAGISVLLGNGDGTFQSAGDFAADSSPTWITTADFNGDGKLDLAVTVEAGPVNTPSVSIFLGEGNGTFQHEADYPSGVPGSGSLTAADFNGDGKLDLAAAAGDGSVGAISILFGNGNGTFQLYSAYTATAWCAQVAAGDFNGDGRPDLVTANTQSAETVSVLLQTVNPVTTLSTTGPINFGTELAGSASQPQSAKLTNTGNATLTISGLVATGDFSETNTCGSSVAIGQSCSIIVRFKPTAKGTLTGVVSITDNAPGSPQTISLTGTGTLLKLSATSLSFGGQPIGTTSNPQAVTLTNVSLKVPITVQGLGLAGLNPFAFAQTNTCGASIAPGGSCTVSVTFTPKTKGVKSATLDIGDNGGGSPQTVALSGTGT